MALDTYANLQTFIASWASRTYATGQVVDAITLGEARINADLALDATATKISATMTQGSRTYTNDPLANVVRAIRYGTSYGSDPIHSITPEQFSSVQLLGNGRPTHYTVRTATIEWNCPADFAYPIEIEAFGRLGLAASTTNWLLTNLPQVYVNAIFAELTNGPERNTEEWQKWEMGYKRALKDARALLNRMMARSEARTVFDTPDLGSGMYNISSDD